MADLQSQASLSTLLRREEKLVTPRLFEAYLACPTKCYLLAIGEVAANNDFAIWKETLSETYLCEGVQRLTTDHHSELALEPHETGHWQDVSWHFAINLIARAENIEANLQVVQRIPLEGTNKSSRFVPIRFIPALRQTDGQF
jgi:hypothetical protein